jgi:chain length determinant protein (polysaccharide antigen chain regulator)
MDDQCVCRYAILLLVVPARRERKMDLNAIIAQPDAAQVASYNNALNILYGNAAPSMNDVQTRYWPF